MALAFLQSPEYDTELIIQDYQQLLGRTPAAVELAAWPSAMQQGTTDSKYWLAF